MATRAKKAKTKSRYRNKFKTEWSAELTSRVSYKETSAFIHYVILLHKYIELPILYKYFGIFYCESEIKYSENCYSKIMSQGQKRPQNSSDCSIYNLDFKNFWGRPPDLSSGAASLRSPTATVPATSTSFLIFREVDLPLYAFSYLAPLDVFTFDYYYHYLQMRHTNLPFSGY